VQVVANKTFEMTPSRRPNEQRLSDAAAALGKGRGGAWRQINPVELNRRSVGV
jgi:hypothetical protein